MRHAIIMAGGSGQRLWPASRRLRPKQLLPLIDGKNLLQLAVERLEGLFEPENILIVTNTEYADAVAESVNIPRENVIGEPMGRDTANAICLGACQIAKRDPDGTMAVFAADHIMRPQQAFAASVATACDVAETHPDSLVTFGIRPTWPHTGLGYIKRGDKIADGVYSVKGFREKPTHPVARRYVESGEYYWNSGMFVWKVQTIRQALQKHLPGSLSQLDDAVASDEPCCALAEAYPHLEKISIDFAVMEKAEKVIVVELGCEWLDVGSWPSLAEVSEIDEDGNAIVAERTALLDSERNVIVCEKPDHLIAVLGMDDCIVVHSADATLVCHRSESQRLKELVQLINDKYDQAHL